MYCNYPKKEDNQLATSFITTPELTLELINYLPCPISHAFECFCKQLVHACRAVSQLLMIVSTNQTVRKRGPNYVAKSRHLFSPKLVQNLQRSEHAGQLESICLLVKCTNS